MLFTKAALCLSSFVLLASAQQSENAFYKGVKPVLARSPVPTPGRLHMIRDLTKRCETCEECFGEGYTDCPGSDVYCYLPGDAYYGLDSCTADSSTDTDSGTDTTGTDETCYETGATCTSCFGPTYLDCPDGYHCYDPNDPLYDTCPEDDSSSSSGGSGDSSSTTTTDDTCASIYGLGSVPCGDDSCYNPEDGDVCCQDGYHCEGGYTCSSIVGKCCAPGSTSSSCSGSSGGLATSSTRSSLATSTSTSGSTFNTGTTTASGGSSTGVSQISSNTNGAGFVGIQKGLIIAAGVGALVL